MRHNMTPYTMMVYLQQKKKRKTQGKGRSDFDTSCDGSNDNDRVHKKVVKRLRAELTVSFCHYIIFTDIKLILALI